MVSRSNPRSDSNEFLLDTLRTTTPVVRSTSYCYAFKGKTHDPDLRLSESSACHVNDQLEIVERITFDLRLKSSNWSIICPKRVKKKLV